MILPFTIFIRKYRTDIILCVANIVVLMPSKCELHITHFPYLHLILPTKLNARVRCQTDQLSPKRNLLERHLLVI